MNYKSFSNKKIKTEKSKKNYVIAAISVIITIFIFAILALGPIRTLALDIHKFSGRYLLILQNSDELRAQGGFITAVGEINFIAGIPKISLHKSYDFDHTLEPWQNGESFTKVTAPAEIEEIFATDPHYRGWTLRDANWSIDGDTANADITKLHKLSVGEKDFDGTVLVNSKFLERWLREFGSTSVGERNFTAENLFLELEEDIKKVDRHDADAHKTNKNILKKLIGQIIRS